MKKTKLLILISAVLVLAIVLCSCGGLKAANPKKVLTGKYEGEKLLTAAAEVNLEKADIRSKNGKFVWLELSNTADKNIIYNMESNATVFTYTDTDTSELDDISFYETDLFDFGFFAVTICSRASEGADDTYTTTLYDEIGKQIATANSEYEEVYTTLDLFTFNGKCYRVAEDKTYTELTGWNELAGNNVLKTLDTKTENYYYSCSNAFIVGDYSSGRYVAVYDKDLNYISRYSFPEYALGGFVGILKDGKVLIQYSEMLPDTAEKYDYLDNHAQKYQLVTCVFDAKKGNTTNLKCDYYFHQMVARSDAEYAEDFGAFFDKVKAVAVVAEIRDGRLSTTLDDRIVVALSESGKVQYSLSDMFPGMSSMFMPVGENLYVYDTIPGITYIADKEGKVLGDISGNRGMNEKYIFGETKLYNLDMTVALDFAAQDLDYKTDGGNVVCTNQGVFFEKANGSVYFFNGELKEVISELQEIWKTLTVKEDYFIVRHAQGATDVTYTYFSANGTALLTTDYEVTVVAEYDGVYLLKGLKNGENIYYRLAA